MQQFWIFQHIEKKIAQKSWKFCGWHTWDHFSAKQRSFWTAATDICSCCWCWSRFWHCTGLDSGNWIRKGKITNKIALFFDSKVLVSYQMGSMYLLLPPRSNSSTYIFYLIISISYRIETAVSKLNCYCTLVPHEVTVVGVFHHYCC